jgi:hypothetical protein
MCENELHRHSHKLVGQARQELVTAFGKAPFEGQVVTSNPAGLAHLIHELRPELWRIRLPVAGKGIRYDPVWREWSLEG